MSRKRILKRANQDTPPTPCLRSRYSLYTWLLHWGSALLIILILGTSLGSGLGVTSRFPAYWMSFHLTVGLALIALTGM